MLRPTPPKLPQRQLRLPHIVAAHERYQSTLIMKAMTRRVLYAQTEEGYSPAFTEGHSSVLAESYSSTLAGGSRAQVVEGYTPAWSELVHTQRGIWTEFVDVMRRFMKRALSTFPTRPGDKYNVASRAFVLGSKGSGWDKKGEQLDKGSLSDKLGEDLVRHALEENGTRTWRVRFYEGNPVWVYDQDRPVRDLHQPEMDSSLMGRHKSIAELSPRSIISAEWTMAARTAHSRSIVKEGSFAR